MLLKLHFLGIRLITSVVVKIAANHLLNDSLLVGRVNFKKVCDDQQLKVRTIDSLVHVFFGGALLLGLPNSLQVFGSALLCNELVVLEFLQVEISNHLQLVILEAGKVVNNVWKLREIDDISQVMQAAVLLLHE